MAFLNGSDGSWSGWIEDIAVRPDGQIVLAICANGAVYLRIAELSANGSGRRVMTFPTVQANAKAIVLLDDGAILAAGGDKVARVRADGTLDDGFGAGGARTIAVPGGSWILIVDMALDVLGRIVVAANVQGPSWDIAAFRLDAAGNVDAAYGGGDGATVLDLAGEDDYLTSMAIQADGSVLLAGSTVVGRNVNNFPLTEGLLARLDARGEPDPGLDGDGLLVRSLLPDYDYERILGVALQGDGKAVALVGPGWDYHLARFHLADEAARFSASDTVLVRDDEPANRPPEILAQEFSLAENSPGGTIVGTVRASDPDVGQNLHYVIVGGTGADLFAIDPRSGVLSVLPGAVLDYEATPTRTLDVRVTDDGSPALWAEARMTIRLTDVAEAIPVRIDVIPGDPANRIVLGKDAKVQVALLSSATFDATAVDPASLRFGPTGTENSLVRNRRGVIAYSYADVDGDGRLDLLASFDVGLAGFREGDTVARLTGALKDGRRLLGSDVILVEASGRKGNGKPR